MANTKFQGYKVDEYALKTGDFSNTPEERLEDTTYILEFF